MSFDHRRKSADIIPFAARADATNRFTTADRMELLTWQAGERGGVRLAIYARRHDDPPEVGEFASIYPPDGCWAAWGAVRQGRAISVWRARDGRDIGHFATMGEALAAVANSARKRPPPLSGARRQHGLPTARQAAPASACPAGSASSAGWPSQEYTIAPPAGSRAGQSCAAGGFGRGRGRATPRRGRTLQAQQQRAGPQAAIGRERLPRVVAGPGAIRVDRDQVDQRRGRGPQQRHHRPRPGARRTRIGPASLAIGADAPSGHAEQGRPRQHGPQAPHHVLPHRIGRAGRARPAARVWRLVVDVHPVQPEIAHQAGHSRRVQPVPARVTGAAH